MFEKTEIHNLVRNHVSRFIYENMKKELRNDYELQFGRSRAAKMIQDMENSIKDACSRIMNYNIFELYVYEK